MRKITFLFIICFFSLKTVFSDNNLDFEKDLDYKTEKNILFEKFLKSKSKTEKKEYLEKCINFWKYFFWEKNKLNWCIIQIIYAKNKNKKDDFTKNLLKIENDFYKKNRKKILELQFWGDIMLSRWVWARNKKYWYDRILKNFNPNENISKNTILFYNLESPFSETDSDVDKASFIFKANKKNIEVLNWLKKDNHMVISLANNHITNAWWAWIDTSLEILKENNIISVWVWREEENFKEILQNWIKVCFSAYTYDWYIFYSRDKNWKKQKYFINKIEKEKILKNLEEMKENNCDFKAISLHWWAEYKVKASKKQKELAHSLIDNWADIIIWHHSHILWEIEDYKGKKIYYSLGNFIFDQNWWKNTNEKWVDYIFDEKLGKNTVQTYIWNTFYNKYEIIWNNINLVEEKNIKHRIDYWELNKY